MNNVALRKVLPTATLIFAATAAFAQWPQMVTDTITNNNVSDETVFKSLDIDHQDTLHLIWVRAGVNKNYILYSKKPCYYSWNDPSYVNDTTQNAGDPFLGVDRTAGVPYIAYIEYTATGSEVVLAHDSAGTWVREDLTATSTDEYSPTVAIDASGKAHVAWIGLDQQSNYRIFYATNLSGSWVSQMLASSNLGSYGNGAVPYIAVDATGIAYIAYRGGNYQSYRVHLANNTSPGGNTWNYQVITTPNAEDFRGSLWVEGSTLYLVSSGNDGWGFPVRAHYSELDLVNNTWSTPQQISATVYGEPSPVFIDNTGKAHVMINQVSGNFITGDIYYATNSSNAWTDSPISTQQNTFNGSVVVGFYGQKAGAAYHETNYSIPSHEVIVWASGACENVVTGIHETASGDLLVYPNPATDEVHIYLSASDITEIRIADMLGREIVPVVSGKEKSIRVDTGNLSKGVYLLRISTGDGNMLSRKLMIE